jgi:hypothetical protein
MALTPWPSLPRLTFCMLEGHEAELDKLAGERATVKGEVTGETVAVQSVTPAKKT